MNNLNMKDEEATEEIVEGDYMEDDTGEDFTIEGKTNHEEAYFDMIISHIQDIVFDCKFKEMQNNFFKEHCNEFEENEENKLIYTEVFQKYKQTIESYIEDKLKEVIKGFNMTDFLKLLGKKGEQVDDHLADTLLSFTDFTVFKQLILEHKPLAKKPDGTLTIAGTKAKVHTEEQSDGEEMPDLMLDIRPYHNKE